MKHLKTLSKMLKTKPGVEIISILDWFKKEATRYERTEMQRSRIEYKTESLDKLLLTGIGTLEETDQPEEPMDPGPKENLKRMREIS
jgi:hypothetical protein